MTAAAVCNNEKEPTGKVARDGIKDADAEAQYRLRCYYIRLLTVVGMNVCLWLTTYLMSPPLAHTPASVVPSTGHSTTTAAAVVDFVVAGADGGQDGTNQPHQGHHYRHSDGYRPLFRVATDREAGALSITTAKDSFYFSALIASAFFLMTVAIRFGSRLVSMAEEEKTADRHSSNTAVLLFDNDSGSDTTGSACTTAKSQELSSFLELGKSFLSPEFLKEMLEEEAPSLAVKCKLPSPPDSLIGADMTLPPGLAEDEDELQSTSTTTDVEMVETKAEPKLACDVRNWRSSDKAPSLANNRTLNAFHNLNASRKVPHHFYPDPQSLTKQPYKENGNTNTNGPRHRRPVSEDKQSVAPIK